MGIQPDSIIPDPSNPQAYNRYSYVYGNPLKYTDPSGHDPKCGPDGIWCGYDGSGYAGGTGSKGGGGGDSNPSTGGGGNTEVDIPSCGYHHCEVETNLYEMGWENFGQAWDIYSSPNATYGQRFIAGAYMSYWGGAHALFVVGSALLLREGIIIIGTHFATYNPNAPAAMIGRYKSAVDNYMTRAGKQLTYFSLKEHYGWLNRIGLAEPMNKQFILNQVNKAKDFFVYGSEYLKPGGAGLRMETTMLRNLGYTEMGKVGGQSFFDNLFQLIP